MPDPKPLDKIAAVWPPAITLPVPPSPNPRLCKTARLAKASLWAAGAGALFSLSSFIIRLETGYGMR